VLDYTVTVPAPTETDRKQMEFAKLARLRAAEACHNSSALVREVLNDKELSDKLDQSGQDNEERAKYHAELAAQAGLKAHVYYLLRANWFIKDGRSANLQTRALSMAHDYLIPSGENRLKGANIADRIKKAREEYAHALDHGPDGHCHRENCEGKERKDPLFTRVITYHHP